MVDFNLERLLAEWDEAASERSVSAREFFGAHAEVQRDPALMELLMAKADKIAQATEAYRKWGRASDKFNRPAIDYPRLEGYTLRRLLGQGGSGSVFLMCDPQGREVAVKVLNRADKTEVARFAQEASLIKGLRNTCIVKLIEYRHDAGKPVLIMEYVAGEDLKEIFAINRASATQAAKIAARLAGAIAYAHSNGVIHRDIKPSNVLMTVDQGVKILDFGLAKLIGSDAQYTRTGQWLGTPQYMAPEQFAGGEDAATPAVDVWGIGGVLYYLLTGKPIREVGGDLATWQQRVPRFVRTLNSTVPRSLEAICMKCLARNPSQRYQSALELQEDLQRFLEEKPVQAPLITSWQRATKVVGRHTTRPQRIGVYTVVSLLVALVWISFAYPLGAEIVDAEEMLQHIQRTPVEDRDALFKREYRGRRIRSRGRLTNLASMASPSATDRTLTEGLCGSFNDVNDVLIIASFDESQRDNVLALPMDKPLQVEGIVMGYIMPDGDAVGIPDDSPIPFEESWDGRATAYIETATFPTISVTPPRQSVAADEAQASTPGASLPEAPPAPPAAPVE